MGARLLGDTARIYTAQTDSGIYRGEIIGQTEHHVVQRLSQGSAVAHPKELLGTLPSVGENVVLRYSNGKLADIAAFEPKVQAKGLAR
jgi:hypothetical protein